MRDPLSVAVSDGPPTVLKLVGELDLSSVSILQNALARLDDADIIIDCAGLQFLDSTGISVFVNANNERTGRTMVLDNVTGIPRRALEICGLLETFAATDDDSGHHPLEAAG